MVVQPKAAMVRMGDGSRRVPGEADDFQHPTAGDKKTAMTRRCLPLPFLKIISNVLVGSLMTSHRSDL